MQSKTSLVNKQLLVYLFRSSGWVSLLYLLGLLFALPLEVLMAVLEERSAYYYQEGQNLFFIQSTIQFALIIVIPVLLAIFLFRFLQVKSLSDFIHSLPVSRKQIYVHHLGAGIVFLLVPILITALILLVLHWTLDVSQLYTVQEIGSWIGITLLVELLIFSVAVLIGICTGLSALQAVLTYVMLLLPLGLVVLFVSNIKFLLVGFSGNDYLTSNIEQLSPLIVAAGLNKVTLFSVDMLIYVVLTVFFLFLAYFLYKRRKHEYVSHAFVFRAIKPVFKYGMTTCVMLLSGFYFSEITEHVGWLIFGYVIGAIFGYLVAEMVLQKTWRIQLQLKGFSYYVVVVLACIVVIKLDVVGFETKVPDVADIKKVYVHEVDRSYYDDGHPEAEITLIDAKNLTTLRTLHEQIIKHGKHERFAPSWETPSIFIKYELTNGRKMTREYFLSNNDDFSPYFEKIYESQEYKQKAYSLLDVSPKDMYRMDISSNGPLNKSIQLSDPRQIKQAMEALQADLAERTFEQMTAPVGEYGYIDFTLEKNRMIHFTWLASDQHFNEWIEQTGKSNQVGVQADDFEYMVIEEYQEGIDYYDTNYVPQKDALKVEKVDRMDSLLATVSPAIERKYVVVLYYKGSRTVDVRGLSEEYAPNYVTEYFE